MKKDLFIDTFKTAMEIEDITHIAVKVMQPKSGFEVIIFGKDLFEDKFEYYNNAYDDGMRLKAFNKIYISEISFCNNAASLAEEMFGMY